MAEFHETVAARDSEYPLRGRYDERFRPVADAFIENFRVEEELGAACSVMIDGQTVVDLWGGWARADRTVDWDEHDDRVHDERGQGSHRASASTWLIDRGLVDPERARRGLLARVRAERESGHHRAHGARPYRGDAGADRRRRCIPAGSSITRPTSSALEVQQPLWQPGTRAAYHVHNQGFLLGEIMRRVTGMTVGPFLREKSRAAARRILHRRNGRRRSRRTSPKCCRTWTRGCSPPRTGVPTSRPRPKVARRGAAQLRLPPKPHEPWHTTMNSPVWRTSRSPAASATATRAGSRASTARRSARSTGSRLLRRRRLEAMITEQHNQTEAAAGPAVPSGDRRAAQHARGGLHGTEHAQLRPSRPRRLDRLRRSPTRKSASRTAATRCTRSAPTARARARLIDAVYSAL